MSAVALEAIEKSFGSTQVVRALSLEIEKGELLALLGPSGCGKTTTLRMIAGLERPTAGRITIDGTTVDDGARFVEPERRQLGMVFQSYAVWPHKSVFENVAYPLQLAREGDVDAKVKEALGWVRLESLAHRRPDQLSGGQLQRVALARALVARPKVLLLDEPLSNLDVALREELRGEIAALRARLGTTMVLVTHEQAEALALADRVAVMSGGVVEQVATPELVYRHPRTPFVAAFVGGANVLEGSVEGEVFTHRGVHFTLPAGDVSRQGRVTVVVRTEDVTFDSSGTTLPLMASLFLGGTVEHRLDVGGTVLRAVAAQRVPGPTAAVRLSHVTLFEPRSAQP